MIDRGDLPILGKKIKDHVVREIRQAPRTKWLADRYAVSPRTIRRWRSLGVDVDRPSEVARHIVEHPSGVRVETLDAIKDLLAR